MNFIQELKSEFTFKHLKQDLPASLAVFLVAVPLCLGIAHASDTPLMSGLITGIIGGIVVGILSKSPLSVSGPAAGLTAIVAAAASELKSFDALLVAIFLAGLIQIGLGLLKAGSLASYIPNAVIKGMLSAIGVILILKQIPHLLGYDAEAEGSESFIVQEAGAHAATAADSGGHPGIGNTFSLLWDAIQNFTPHILLIGLVSLGVIVFWDKTFGKRIKVIPSSLVAVVVGTCLAVAYGFIQQELAITASHLVQIPKIGSLGEFIQQTSFPAWQALSNPKVYSIALTLALVASIETLLSIEAIDKMDPNTRLRTPTNRELIAQGVGNSLAGLVGGLPMTSVIVRSSVNLVAGAMSKLSAIFHGAWLLIAVMFAAPLINLIPLAALAAVLIMTGLKLASPQNFKQMFRDGWDQFVPYVVTIVAIVLTDLLIGVLIGLGVSGIFILYNHYRSEVIGIQNDGDVYTLMFAENLTFLNKGKIQDVLDGLPEQITVNLDISRCKYIDHDVMELLFSYQATCETRQVNIIKNHLPDEPETTSKKHAQRLELLANGDVKLGSNGH